MCVNFSYSSFIAAIHCYYCDDITMINRLFIITKLFSFNVYYTNNNHCVHIVSLVHFAAYQIFVMSIHIILIIVDYQLQ